MRNKILSHRPLKNAYVWIPDSIHIARASKCFCFSCSFFCILFFFCILVCFVLNNNNKIC